MKTNGLIKAELGDYWGRGGWLKMGQKIGGVGGGGSDRLSRVMILVTPGPELALTCVPLRLEGHSATEPWRTQCIMGVHLSPRLCCPV